MTKAHIDSLKSVLRLLRFLFWYAVVVVALVYLLPFAGEWVQGEYEAMSVGARATSVAVVLVGVTVWQLAGMFVRRKHLSDSPLGNRTNSP
jgi:uncharacterized membrane protein